MNLNQFASDLCKEETGKVQVNIAQMKEIMKFVAIALYQDPSLLIQFLKYGKKKAEE